MEVFGANNSNQDVNAIESPHQEIPHGWVDVADTRAHFLVQGNGPPIVLLHGQGENCETWRWVLPALARTNRVFALDLPGAGESAKPTAYAAPPSFYADFLLGFIHALGLERVTIIGASYGGLIAIRVALAAPDRVDALCLVDSSGFGRMTNPALMALTIPGFGDSMAAWWSTPVGSAHFAWMFGAISFAQPLRAPPEWYANMAHLAQTPGHLRSAVLACLRGELDLLGQREVRLDELSSVTIPTLIVWGANDAVVPLHHATNASGRFPNSRLVVIPDCGHVPHVEQPQQFIAAVENFIKENEIARAYRLSQIVRPIGSAGSAA